MRRVLLWCRPPQRRTPTGQRSVGLDLRPWLIPLESHLSSLSLGSALLLQARQMGLCLLCPLICSGSPGTRAKLTDGSPAPSNLLFWQALNVFCFNFPKNILQDGGVPGSGRVRRADLEPFMLKTLTISEKGRQPVPTGVCMRCSGHKEGWGREGGFPWELQGPRTHKTLKQLP